MRRCSVITPFQGSGCGAAEKSGEIYLRWERSSSEISAIGAIAEEMRLSRANDNDERTGKTGLKVVVALICWECIGEL